jgi:hypothetical protein
MRQIIIALFSLLIINGCGGGTSGSGGSSTFNDSGGKPIFISKDKIEIDRDKIDNFTFLVSASDATDITYHITGTDADLFSIDGISGKLTLKENNIPKDISTLKITAVVMDSVGHRESQNITVTVVGNSGNSNIPTEDNTTTIDNPQTPDSSQRFQRDDIEDVVIDNEKNLMWQDDIEARMVQKPWITMENYNICKENIDSSPACNDSSGDTAITYCDNLTLAEYTNWRLPTKNELKSIVDKTSTPPALIYSSFENIYPNSPYWTTTTDTSNLSLAWSIDFGEEQFHFWVEKQDDYMIRCVRDIE